MTMKMRNYALVGVLSLVALLASCGDSNPQSEPQATGPGQGLTRAAEAPLYNIEIIGNVRSPLGIKNLRVAAAGDLTVLGWAVDPVRKDAGSGVEVVVDGVVYPATSGIKRGDVADHFQIPGYMASGYAVEIPAHSLAKGQHQVTVRVIATDGRTYLESPPLIFTLL